MKAGAFLRFFLIDLVKLLNYTRNLLKKNGSDIKMEDIPHLFPEDQTSNRHALYEKYLSERLQKGEIGAVDMFIVFWKTFKWKIIIEILLAFGATASKLGSSLCIRNLIDDISH